ncbi:restriction endonuclease S subunit [Methanococcus maripaludis]|uniref:Restriction endonuclease S subunit n=1 Tax=Methanococcus maripaludis TaxID=39152 RepID=A0A7J9S6R8_METMI|nr:restriction endonuclease subunit S [Methanococcus maripaludis]MBB6401593.1 restriction endonuclease S subunit [Methanococcus maripaludis]
MNNFTFKDILTQYKNKHYVEDEVEYKQVTVSKQGTVSFRGTKKGIEIGRKRQYVIDLKNNPYTLIFTRQGIYDGAIGMAPNEVDCAVVTENMPMFNVNTEKIHPEYLIHYLNSKEFKKSLDTIVPSGTAQKSIHERQFINLPINIPKMENQSKIVNLLNAFFEKRNLFENQITFQLEHASKLRQSILQDAVQGKLTTQNPKDNAKELLKKIETEKQKLIKEKKIKSEKPLSEISKDEIPFEIPENWVWCKLGDICNKITDGTHHSPKNYENGDVMYVTAKNIKPWGIDLTGITYVSAKDHDEIYSRCDPEFGDILYIKDGATTGIVTLNNLNDRFSMLSSVALLKTGEYIENKFLKYLMSSPYFYNYVREDMTGVAITRVTLIKLKKTKLPLPPLEEQQRIVQKVDELMELCDELEQNIEKSKNYSEMLMQSVLQEAFKN